MPKLTQGLVAISRILGDFEMMTVIITTAVIGGSGLWYIPVWWMGATTLAWLGSWTYSAVARKGPVNIPALVGRTWITAIGLFVVAGMARIVPFSSAGMALAFGVALVMHVVLAATLLQK